MRTIIATALFCAIFITGCSSARLKRCPERASDPSLQECPDQVQGAYRMCVKPQNLFVCEDPQ